MNEKIESNGLTGIHHAKQYLTWQQCIESALEKVSPSRLLA
jgi:hypothetical protein